MKNLVKKYSVNEEFIEGNENNIINLKNICSRKVKYLTKDECLELLRIIHTNNIQNSTNNNGTFVNGNNIVTHNLAENDVIHVGSVKMKFKIL